MPILMLSPVGTSLLTNKPVSDKVSDLLRRTANCVQRELSPEDKAAIDARVKEVRPRLFGEDVQVQHRSSAEVDGILTYDETLGRRSARQDVHVLLTTDTYQGELTAALVREFLETVRGQRSVIALTARDLSTRNRAWFSSGIAEVVRWCAEELPQYRQTGYHLVFNLTSGFGSIVG